MCVLDAGRANQSIQQLSSTLEQHHHADGREEEPGKRPGPDPPMDGDKPAWNQKAQSEAGVSVKVGHVKIWNWKCSHLKFSVV